MSLQSPRVSLATIVVSELSKTYVVPEREAGLKASLQSLVRRRHRTVNAVDHISFDLREGEVVGFLGPNGAGKTTTLKMLSGLLYPTSGDARVLNSIPWNRGRAFLRQIALVMGNRSQLEWDIPALDSFELNRAIYEIPPEEFKRTRDKFIELLDLQDLVHKPVRNLSLGERMKMELVGALLHLPRVLFLDEPTIGLDVTMQRRIREFVAEYNHHTGATVLLTSHYMADVVALCQRVIVIHQGRILYDGKLARLSERFATYKTISVTLEDGSADLSRFSQEISRDGNRATLRVRKDDAAKIAAQLLTSLPVNDVTIEDAPIEDVIAQVFAHGKTL